MTRVSIFGLGYVGAVSAACLADRGHEVIGVDVNEVKRDTINSGRSPIVEHRLGELIERTVSDGRLRATEDVNEAVAATDISLICVGTPSNANGSLDLASVDRVSESIGDALARKDGYHVIVVRSTMLPGSTEERVIPALERRSGKRVGADFGICYNPEFLREGSSIKDFYDPAFTVIGGQDARAVASLAELYSVIESPVLEVPIRVAEMLKYASNAFHALKVAFANEIGVLCKRQDIDSHQVMDIFCQDTKLNISPAYLRPGFAFGGSCLPKDLRALLHHSRGLDVVPPILEAILPSNERHIERAFEMVRSTRSRRVGVLGLSFKQGTDDLRESPLVALVERLIGRGYDVRVHDRNVALANLHGTNRAYIEQEIPHIVTIMADSVGEVLDHAEVLIIGSPSAEYSTVVNDRRPGQEIIDLVRIAAPGSYPSYQGICW